MPNPFLFTETELFESFQFSISTQFVFLLFVYTQLNLKTVLFQANQCTMSTQFSSNKPIDRIQPGATTLEPSGPGSDGNEGVLRIPQSSSISEASPWDCLVSYPGTIVGGSLTPLQRFSQCIPQSQPTGPEERADADLGIIFLFSCCSSRKCLLGVLFLHLHSGSGSSSQSSPKTGDVIFGRLHIVVPSDQLTFFSCFPSRVHSHGCSAWSSFGIRRRFANDTFLFLTWTSAAIPI